MMSPREKMIMIVGEAIVKGLHQHADKQENLDSSATRHIIASDILDQILKIIDSPEFKYAKQASEKSQTQEAIEK